jgi:hypothetical protein
MKKLKSLITSITFQIGVNCIGLPEFHTHCLKHTFIYKSKFHK